MKNTLYLVILFFLSFSSQAQYGYRDGNRIGISIGVTQLSMVTSNFSTKPELGWIGGLSVRGNYYNDFSMIFGMQFTESKFSVETVSPLLKKEDVKYTIAGVQVRLLLSYNVVKDHVSLDFGPVLQVNGKLGIDTDSHSNNRISGTALHASDIVDVSKINGNLYIGASAGNRIIRGIISYQYGINNFFSSLNNKDGLQANNNNNSFNGHIGLLSGQLLFNL